MLDWDKLRLEDIDSWESIHCSKCGLCIAYTYSLSGKQSGFLCLDCKDNLPDEYEDDY